MSDAHQNDGFTEETVMLRNNETVPIEVWFEPWGQVHLLQPNQSFRLVARSRQEGRVEVVTSENGAAVVFACSGSTLRVFQEDLLIDDFNLEVPPLPVGMSTRKFFEVVMEGPKKNER